MTTELTSEQIVTKLLSEHQILKHSKGNFYIKNPTETLGEYLVNLPEEEQVILEEAPQKSSRFSFISGSWNV